MSASMLSKKCFRHFGGVWSYSRMTCVRYQQKSCLQENIIIPEAEYETDTQGNLIAPMARPFPKGMDLEPEMMRECLKEPLRYPKTHAGLMHPDKVPHLPKLMVKNARQLLAEKDLISHPIFKKDMYYLQEIYSKRQPPMERQFINAKKEAIKEQTLAAELTKQKINIEDLNDEEREKLEKKVNNLAKGTFQATTHNWKPIEYKGNTGLVYLASRLTLNYTVLHRIFFEIKKRDNNFKPGAILNVGSGTGSAIWAANSIWGKNVFEYYNVDYSNYMNDMARKILSKDMRDPLNLCIEGVNFRQSVPSPKHAENRFPLVVSAFLMMEQPSMKERLNLVSLLWELTDQYLVLVENGTTAGYRLMLEARELIFKLREEYPDMEGHVFSPCTHEEVCPKLQLKKSPCTFSVEYRLLNVDQEYGQGDTKANERYSYVVLKKGKKEEGKRFPRLTSIIHKSSHNQCHMCCPDGTLRHLVITEKRPSKHLFRCTKRCSPGDFIPMVWPTTSKVKTDNESVTNVTNESSEQIQDTEQNSDKDTLENDKNIDENLK